MRILMLSWLFLMPICLILLGADIDVVSGKCLTDQQSLLLHLKANLFNATESKKLNKWNQGSDCCTWDGVTCNSDGHVTGLNLSGESISGQIDDSSLFNLQHLEKLDLSYNNFSTTISSRFGNLTTLTHLNLSNAGFVGQVPLAISNLTKLVTLDLSTSSYLQTSSLKLENPSLTMLVQNLKELVELYLDGVNISAQGNEWGKALSSSLLHLQVLSLSNCYLSGPVDQSLVNLWSLSVIRLNNNNLSAPFPEFFANFSNLTDLRLSSCGLYGLFPEEIFLILTLQTIDITDNQMLQGSLPEFPQNSALQRLVLRQTSFSGKLPKTIGNLWKLSRLDLANCQFSGSLPNSMPNLRQLVYLDLSVNNFSGPIPSFKMSKNLTEVLLSHNDFSGEVLQSHWEGLQKLVNLDLRNNSFNGSIHSSLFAIPSLIKIQLSHNQFAGQLPELPNPSASVLDTLDLSNNKLEGPIPVSIFKIRNLSVLSLSANKLNETVQLETIQGLDNLTTLDLSYNSLSVNVSFKPSTWSILSSIRTLKLASCNLRKFPDLRNQSKLVYLDLSDNQISGDIPNWIWEAGNGSLLYVNVSRNYLMHIQEPYNFPNNLNFLDLRLNKLQGKLPVLPPSATYVDFSSNNFTSTLPADIGNNLTVTIFFSLSNNGLSGVISKSICSAKYLQVLDLSNNSLTGELPECISAMSQSLGVLNLRRNNLTGRIPDAFPANCGLKTLDLNGNLIEGWIPKSLANCTGLEVLNLGNNKLSDNFPCLLKNISTLRVIVLRSNKLQGPIGCVTGTWATLQIVDLAHNNFSGNLLRHCLKKWKAMTIDEDDEHSKLNHLRFQFLQFSPTRYYQDAVTITFKGLEMELKKILTVFTSIDLSCNNLSGQIPKEIGELQALYILNLSHNALTGPIPSTIGKLVQLESLDLSSNDLNGTIPPSLTSLTFLSFLNLSFNYLVGRIPYGNQIQTFSADSFTGNKALCGVPLAANCSDSSEPKVLLGESGVEFYWQSIYTGIGFGVGAGAVFALLMFWDEGKTWLEDCIDKILLVILPMMGCTYKPRQEWDDEDDEDTEDEDSDSTKDHEEDEMEDQELQGRYCVFCSKLDISRKMVIHDPRCTCHSPLNSSSSFSSSSSSDST